MFRKYKPVGAHHIHIDTLPVWNWFKIKETGDYKYLFHDYEKNTVAPAAFEYIHFDMIFQFENVDITLFKLVCEKEYFKSLSMTDKKPIWKAKYYETEIKIQKIVKDSDKSEGLTLNSFIRYIETTLKCIGTLDPKKMTTSYAFSLFEQTKKINEDLNKQHSKYKEK